MMARGAERVGCGPEGSSCMVEKIMIDGKNSREHFLVYQNQMKGIQGTPMDCFSQAAKALAVKLPFETEDGSGSGFIPAAFSEFLANNTKGADNKRKHKKMHNKIRDGCDGNNIARSNQNRCFNSSKIWFEMEEYFREVTAEDIEILLAKTQFHASKMHDSCLLIPADGINYSQLRSERERVYSDHSRADAGQALADSLLHRWESISGLKRKLLSTSPYTKKRKIRHSTPEVLTTIISPSKTGDDKVCNICNSGGSQEGNRILFCDVCHVMVHQQCYGVQQMPEAKWLCSLCSRKFYSSVVSSNREASNLVNYECCQPSGGVDSNAYVCVLCPRTAGALKPVMKMNEESENSGNVEFAHVFCCHWVPETYIEDIEIMEPIKNIEGVAKERWTLSCSLCRGNHGACIKCSHGTCETAFHPLCAKEANLQTEISSKEGGEDVELTAFCAKHSFSHAERTISVNNPSEAAGKGLFKNNVLFNSSEESWGGCEQQLAEAKRVQCKGSDMFLTRVKDWQISSQGVCPANCPGTGDSHFNSRDQSSFPVGGTNTLDGTKNGIQQTSESKESGLTVEVGSMSSIMKKLGKAIQQTQVTLTDVAVEMGVSSDVLTTLIQGDKCAISSDLQRRISTWLYGHHLSSTMICQSESTDEHENSLDVQISNLDGLKETFVHARQFNRKSKNLKTHQKEPSSSREYKSVGTVSSLCKERGDNNVAMDESSTKHFVRHDIVLDLPLKSFSGKNCIKTMVQPVVLECKNENQTVDILKVRALQGTKISNSFLKDLEIDSMNVVVDEMVPTNPLKDVGAKCLDEERRKRGLSKDASTSHSCCAIEPCDVVVSRNLQSPKLKEMKKLVGSTPKQNNQPANDLTINKDSSVGIGKDNQFGHTSSKAESTEVSDWKELCQLGNHLERASIYFDKSLEEYSGDATPVTDVCLNVDGYHAGSYDGNFISMEMLNAQTDVDCGKEAPQSYAHRFIQKKLVQQQHASASFKGYGNPHTAVRDHWEGDMTIEENQLENAQVIKHEKDPASNSSTVASVSVDFQWKQLHKARNKGILDLVPDDDLEAEIMFLQNALLEYAHANHHRCENLILRVITNVSEEQQASRRQRWDTILVKHYLNQIREMKKQSRKDRRHKEPWGALTRVTASPRIGSSRIFASGDAINEHVTHQAKHKLNVIGCPDQSSFPRDGSHNKVGLPSLYPISQLMKLSIQKPLKVNIGAGWPSSCQTSLRVDETLSRHTGMKASSASQNDACQSLSDSQRVELLLCDICSSQEYTCSNKIYVCHHCKVAVHQDCYGILSFPSSGRWYCQPCLAIQQQSQDRRLPDVVSQQVRGCYVECALCGGLSGALKKSDDGLWVHVFCAEWMPETTIRKCQVDPVYGLQAVSRERYALTCCICHRHQGACLMCDFNHCNNAFHPLCARDFGLYMSTKVGCGGKNEHIAYCQEHTSNQTEKAESWQCGSSEGLIYIKQVRVELERVRLICERIVKREKLKRELLHCSHNILASKRDCIAYSAVFHSSFFPPADMVSTSADISLLGNAGCNTSRHDTGIQIFQMPNESPVESSECGKLGGIIATQSEVSNLLSSGHDGSAQFGRISTCDSSLGSESASCLTNLTVVNSFRNEQHRKPKKSRKHTETLPREVVMTPTEASMQNRRLPKGYAYVPVGCLTKGKSITQDTKLMDI